MSSSPPDDKRGPPSGDPLRDPEGMVRASTGRFHDGMRALQDALKRDEERWRQTAAAVKAEAAGFDAGLQMREAAARALKPLDAVTGKIAPMPSIPGLLEEILDALRASQGRAGGPRDERSDAAGLTQEGQALALLVMNEAMSISEVADALGVNRTTPYTWKKFMRFWNLLRGTPADLPRGEKDEEGNIEAEA